MSIKYIPKVNLRNRCWLATDATGTGRGRERKEWQKFSVFHLFPIPMLAPSLSPSLPVRPIAPHSSVDGPAGPPMWRVVAVAAVALSLALRRARSLSVPADCLSSSVAVLNARAHGYFIY